MSQTIYLEPEQTAPYEPREGDGRNGSWISPSDVPVAIDVRQIIGTDKIDILRFEYRGGETGLDRGNLDDRTDPSIWIKSGRFSGKILEMGFNYPITASDFPRIAERLIDCPSSITSVRFSRQMVANILRHWTEIILANG